MLSLPHAAGQIISYIEMCQAWSVSFQKGMYYHLRPSLSVLLMSRRQARPTGIELREMGAFWFTRVMMYRAVRVVLSQSQLTNQVRLQTAD